MSTIKISELPKFTTINANTSNTLFVGIDIPSAQTFSFSAKTLAEGLFANTTLIVGNKGFIYTPTIYPGAQTSITINYANNSVVRAQTSSGLVVTLSNLLAGKEVVAWITNTAGSGQTFTHGVSAINSTVNATTYSIPALSTILVRYMSIDGTLQNTFAAVTHA